MKSRIYIRLIIFISLIGFVFCQTQLGSDINGGAPNQYLGYSVSIDSIGTTLISSGTWQDSIVNVFRYEDDDWVKKSTINTEVMIYSIKINNLGNRVIIGGMHFVETIGWMRSVAKVYD